MSKEGTKEDEGGPGDADGDEGGDRKGTSAKSEEGEAETKMGAEAWGEGHRTFPCYDHIVFRVGGKVEVLVKVTRQ
ncbi:hypothetical protein KI387_032241, partial [Taxus chinensis]